MIAQAQSGPRIGPPRSAGIIYIMKGMVEFESTAWLYPEALSASPRRTFGHGFRSGAFYQGESGDLADLKRTVCFQSVYTADGGDGDDHHALCFHCDSDTDPEKELSSDAAHAAAGRDFLRIFD